MKVYVDELPKRCLECGFCCKDDLGYWCQGRESIGGVFIADEMCVKQRLMSCPLQSLADHTKQVRKEVCEEIRKWCDKNFNWVGDGAGYDGQDYSEMIGSNNTINKLRELLDQLKNQINTD